MFETRLSVYRAVVLERVYRAVAPSNAGYVGMFETRLSVCMCSGVLFGVRSEAELLPRERV
jgi:hypothetical protein